MNSFFVKKNFLKRKYNEKKNFQKIMAREARDVWN